MIKLAMYREVCKKSLEMIDETAIVISLDDREKMSAVDFGLSQIRKEGVQILTMFETDRMGGKILVLLPGQTLPEHWHPSVGEDEGKEELIRAISGELYVYIPGVDTMKHGFTVDGKEDCYTMRHEVVLKPGEQLVLPAGTKHWFQAGVEGAVMYSFSTRVRDLMDQFTDPDIVRETKIEDQ